MVFCEYCRKNVTGIRPYDGTLACNICGRILEIFNLSTEVTFVKNAAGQTQATGNIVRRSVKSEISTSREWRIRKARDEFTNLRDALGIGDERDDVVDMATRFFTAAVEQNFTKGRRTELVQSSCLYLTCREKNIPVLLIDFSSYLRVHVYEIGGVYLQLCEMLNIAENWNYEKLVDPSIYIPRFTHELLKGKNDKAVVRTARDIIASMKRDWVQTGRPSGICGAALYIAALSHGIKCSNTDIVKIVHIGEATLIKRLFEFQNTEAASLNVDELTERERVFHKRSLTRKPNSDKKGTLCMHQDCKPFDYGLCEKCYNDFINVSGGLAGGSDPPAFQRAEKERKEKAAREKNHGEGVNQPNSKRDPFYSEELDDGDADASDGSENLSDISDSEVNWYIRNEDEISRETVVWQLLNPDNDAMKAAKEAARAANANLVKSSKAAVKRSRKEKQQKRAEEAKNMPPPATTMEAVRRTLDKKRLDGIIDYDALEALLDTSVSVEKSPKRSKSQDC